MNGVDLWVIEKKHNESFINTKNICTKILGKYVDLKQYPICHNLYGKPILSEDSKVFFNISHSVNLLLVAVTKKCNIGIDLEYFNRGIYDPLRIAEKNFHKNEVQWLNQSSTQFIDFKKLWVIKEAYVKMHGQGISYGLNNFYVNVKKKLIFDVKKKGYWDYSLFDMSNNYICCIVPRFNKITKHILPYEI